MFGNHVAHSERKVRRTWLPNLQKHRYRSEILDELLELKVTTETMRNIDRLGGFDNYILKTPEILLGGTRSLGSRIKARLTEAYNQKVVIDARLAELEETMKKNTEALIKAQAKADAKAQLEALQKATGHGV